jgi:hypothetical protein
MAFYMHLWRAILSIYLQIIWNTPVFIRDFIKMAAKFMQASALSRFSLLYSYTYNVHTEAHPLANNTQDNMPDSNKNLHFILCLLCDYMYVHAQLLN